MAALTEDEEFELLSLERERAMAQQQSTAKPSISSILPTMAGLAVEDIAKKSAIPAAITLAGAMGGAPAAGLAAGTAAIGRRMAGIASGQQPPSGSPLQEAIGPMSQAALAGVAQEPAVLNQIPGVPQVKNMIGNLANKVGRGFASAGQTLSGTKKDVLKQAYEQGLSTYKAPSLPKAQEIFSEALGPEGRETMKQTASETFDPAVSKARSIATDIGTKIENGESVTALQALKARQSTDRVISATPITDKVTRSALYEWRRQFDDVISSQSGKLANASRVYRQAIVKDMLLSPTRITKSGEPSAFLPLVLGAGGRGIEGVLSGLVGTSPIVHGLAATTAGSTARGLNVLGQNPTVRQALLQILQKIRNERS